MFAAANRLFKEGMLERSESYFIKGLSLADWQRLGKDTGSVVAEPLFVDPDHGNSS